jgi:hypothetical protein
MCATSGLLKWGGKGVYVVLMSPRNRAFLALPFLLLLLSAAAPLGCGPSEPSQTPSSTTTTTKPSNDKTVVTMEAVSFDGAAPSSPTSSPTAATAPTTSTSTAPDPADDPNIGGVQEGALEKAVAPTRPRLRACYKKALAVEPNVGGSATFDVTIGNAGKAATVRFVKRNGLNEDMIGCLLPAIKAMAFEPTQKSQILTLSFGTPPTTSTSNTTADAGAKK